MAPGQSVRSFLAEVVRALNARTVDGYEDRPLSWLAMQLDEAGLEALTVHQTEWLEKLERIKAEAATRLTAGGEPGERFIAGTMAFETPPGPGFAETES
jgi:hypothetical protein